MSKFQNYMKQFDIASNVTEDEVEKAEELLQLYSPLLRRAAQGIDDMEDFCVDSRRQSISDFITLAIDYDHDGDSKRIADRLAAMGHSMQLLSLMDAALVLVKADSIHGKRYYDILRMRYFDAYCISNEDAFLSLGISSSTYYRNIKPAIRLFAANLWCIVIPNLILAEQVKSRNVGVLMGVE